MNIGVIGGGATGLLTSYYLNEIHHVTLYVRRKEQKDIVLKNGIKEVTNNETQYVNVKQINELKDEQLLIICVKSINVREVIKVIEQKNNNTPILFLQNGMGHVALFSTIENEVYVGVIEHGIVRKNDYTFHHLGKGKIKISAIIKNEKAEKFVNELSTTYFPFELVEDWNTLLKEKLIVNAVINPLTALFDVENRFIIKNSYIRQLARQLCEEVATVLKLNVEENWKNIIEIAKNTGNNTSSMRSDIINKRKTEIESILGYILKQQNHHIPLVKTMYKSIKALEERNKF